MANFDALKKRLGKDVEVQDEDPEISQLESGLRGAAQGATFGLAPAISGAAQALPEAYRAVTGDSNTQAVLDAYNKARESSKSQFEAAQAANPKTFLAGDVAGSLAPALLTGGASEAGLAARGLSGLTKGLLSPARAAGLATDVGYGALSSAGHALSEGKDLADAASSVGKGALGGAANQAIGSFGKIAKMVAKSPYEKTLLEQGAKIPVMESIAPQIGGALEQEAAAKLRSSLVSDQLAEGAKNLSMKDMIKAQQQASRAVDMADRQRNAARSSALKKLMGNK